MAAPASMARRRPSILLSSVTAAIVAVLATFTIGNTVLAHSGLGAASPAPGSTVGGEITEFQLRYNRTVADVSGSVTDPDGNVVDSEWIQDGNLRVAVVLAAPLSVPGKYTVRHSSLDVTDNDRVDTTYQFTYDPAAPPPQLKVIPDDGGFPWVWIVFGVGAVVIGVLGWQLSRSLKRPKPQSTTA